MKNNKYLSSLIIIFLAVILLSLTFLVVRNSQSSNSSVETESKYVRYLDEQFRFKYPKGYKVEKNKPVKVFESINDGCEVSELNKGLDGIGNIRLTSGNKEYEISRASGIGSDMKLSYKGGDYSVKIYYDAAINPEERRIVGDVKAIPTAFGGNFIYAQLEKKKDDDREYIFAYSLVNENDTFYSNEFDYISIYVADLNDKLKEVYDNLRFSGKLGCYDQTVLDRLEIYYPRVKSPEEAEQVVEILNNVLPSIVSKSN